MSEWRRKDIQKAYRTRFLARYGIEPAGSRQLDVLLEMFAEFVSNTEEAVSGLRHDADQRDSYDPSYVGPNPHLLET